MTKKPPATYDEVVLHALAYESSNVSDAETEKQITSRLKRRRLGAYDAGRVENLRRLKNDLAGEIGLMRKSAYYVRPHGEFATPSDFDLPRLTADMIARHREVPRNVVQNFVPFAIYLYYLR